MALPGKFKAKKRKGKKAQPFSIWTVFSWFCVTSDQPIPNEISETERVFWLFFFYVIVGLAYYFFSSPYRDSLTFADTVYFLVTTMTTVGYGDIVPPSDPAARLWTIFFVVWGLIVTMAGLNELAGYILEMRERIVESMRAAVLNQGNKPQTTYVEDPDDPSSARRSVEEARLSVEDAAAERLLRRSAARMSSFKSFETELASKGVTGWRAQLTFLWNVPSLARKQFPVIDIVLYLGTYSIFWAWLYSSIEEDMTFIDAMYFAMVTGTTVGYGDVSPQTVAGRWLTVFFLPFAVVFVGSQMNAIGDLFSGSNAEGAMEKMLKLDLSAEGLLDMDTDGDGTITEFEFLKYMLVKSGMGEAAVLDSLHKRFQSMDEDNSGVLTAEDMPKMEPFGCPTSQKAQIVPQNSLAYATSAWSAALAKSKASMSRNELVAMKANVRNLAAKINNNNNNHGGGGDDGGDSPPNKKKKKKKAVSHGSKDEALDVSNFGTKPTNLDAAQDLGLIRVHVKGSPVARGNKIPPRASREEVSLLTGGGPGPSANEQRVAERRSRASNNSDGDVLLPKGVPNSAPQLSRKTTTNTRSPRSTSASGGGRGSGGPGGRGASSSSSSRRSSSPPSGSHRPLRPGFADHDSPLATRKKSTVPRNPLEAGRVVSVDGSPPTSAESSLSNVSANTGTTTATTTAAAAASPRPRPSSGKAKPPPPPSMKHQNDRPPPTTKRQTKSSMDRPP